ncbi:hypothetical protein GM3709_2119 [Geminocystis sp. NIES-3709]|nr:hypothetical protein GM3709_2119 [Geminocystis sp. NIES-3709]
MFLTATAFGFIGNDRSTLTLSMSSVNLPVNQIAMGEEKTEASDKNLEGKTESQMEESQKFDTETQDGISNAIQNPDYKPSGKTKGAEKEDRQATKDIKAEASDAMLSTK